MKDKAKIAVLVSGGGTNLQALIDAQNSGIINSGKIEIVISNNADAYALERARNAGIKTAVVDKKKVGKDIQRLRAQKPSPEEYRFLLFRRGGTSLAMGIASAAIYFFGMQILLNLLLRFLL